MKSTLKKNRNHTQQASWCDNTLKKLEKMEKYATNAKGAKHFFYIKKIVVFIN